MSTSYCVSPGKKYIKLREKYFDILDSFIVVASKSDVKYLNNKIRSACESMWLLGSQGLCFGSSAGVMSENGFYFKEHDKVLAVYPDGFSEFGYIIKGKKRGVPLDIFVIIRLAVRKANC